MSKEINIDTTMGNFVSNYPKSRMVFEQFDLDYCCGGNMNIKMALKEKNIDVEKFTEELRRSISSKEKDSEKTWINESLTDIIKHIEKKHHGFLKEKLPYVDSLIEKLIIVHGPRHGEFLKRLSGTYKMFRGNLEQHLNDEEILLFPFIKEFGEALKNKDVAKEVESYKKIVEILYTEHDETGDALKEIREMTSNYTVPDDACASFGALYENLKAIEESLHEHVHLENNVLFPRVEKLLI